MNRLQHVDVPQAKRSTPRVNKSTNRLSMRHESQPNFHQFIPLHYEKNYAYPLIVWLHGPTGSENEVSQVMPHVSMRNFLGVSPRGVVTHPLRHPNGDPTFTWNQDSQSIEWAIDDVLKCIDNAKRRFNVAPNRIFLAGNDVGGTMALRIALTLPQMFAGVASIGGPMPDTSRPLAGFHAARSMPVLLMQGRESEDYDAGRLCGDIRLLHSAGMQLNVRQYPCGQEVTTKMLSDLNAWIMERVAGAGAGVCSDATICEDDPTHLRARDCN